MVTKKAESCMKNLARLMKKQAGDCWKRTKKGNKAKIGCWELDCNSVYGGCVIEEMVNEGGGVSTPFGSMRRKPTSFCETINFAIRALEYKKRRR